MKNSAKNQVVTVIIVLATIILAGVAVFTAIRLYQLKGEPVSPATPQSKPAAATEEIESVGACEVVTFTINSSSIENTTPTDTPETTNTPTPTDTLVSTYTPTPTEKLIGGGESPTPTITKTLTVTSTPTAAEMLPDAGLSFPTLVGFASGALLVILALTIAL